MATYISILRGINVSGQKLIKMDALRKLYENLGFGQVTTYVQSGNIIFTSSNADTRELERQISLQIEKETGWKIPVMVLTFNKLKQIIDNNPFTKDPNNNQAFMHVTFLWSAPLTYDSVSIENKKQPEEKIAFFNDAVYLYCPDGYGKTKLTNNFLETKLKIGATTRNWKTTSELLKIAQELS